MPWDLDLATYGKRVYFIYLVSSWRDAGGDGLSLAAYEGLYRRRPPGAGFGISLVQGLKAAAAVVGTPGAAYS